ncbi:MAG: hypothetical protein RL497_3041 [Pseudomonadota bacterium]
MQCVTRGFCVIRVNANPQLGNGHLMRCLTIAQQAKKQQLTPIFVLSDMPGVPLRFIEEAGFAYNLLPVVHEMQDAELLCLFIKNLNNPCWVVVDVYAFSECWHKTVSPFSQQLLVVDDLANRKYFCDFLMDYTPGRQLADYIPWVNASAHLCLGCEHALLGESFFAAVPSARLIRKSYFEKKLLPKLLISLGGTDPKNLSLVWFDLLSARACEFGGITFLLASNAQVIPALSEKINRHNQERGIIRLVVDAQNVPQLMLEHDLALGGAGVSALERAVLGLPSAMLTLAENQITQAQALHESGCALYLGDWQQLPSSTTQQKTLEQLMGLKNNYLQWRALSECAFNLVSAQQNYRALTQFFNTSRVGNTT